MINFKIVSVWPKSPLCHLLLLLQTEEKMAQEEIS